MSTNFLTIARKYLHSREVRDILCLKGERTNCRFLAQGEYNINFLVTDGERKWVLRLNTGSQMHLENQISYEFETLKILEKTGVTPAPVYCDDSLSLSDHGMLIMDYIPGNWMDYRRHFLLAAEIFSRIHSIKTDQNTFLIITDNPAAAILSECAGMMAVYQENTLGDQAVKNLLGEAHQQLQKRIETVDISDGLVLNNTEVNSSNFLYDEVSGTMKLVDWEKAVFSLPGQDLAHFLVPTTTLWKSDFRFSRYQVELFARTYCNLTHENFSDIMDQIYLFWNLTCLRGISWCAMAYIEYMDSHRPLKNDDTFKRIKQYLQPEFIQDAIKL